jgi:hypothetical protein
MFTYFPVIHKIDLGTSMLGVRHERLASNSDSNRLDDRPLIVVFPAEMAQK